MAANRVKKGSLAQMDERVSKIESFLWNHVSATLKWHSRGIWAMIIFNISMLGLIIAILALVIGSL